MSGQNDISPFNSDNHPERKLSGDKLMAWQEGSLSPAEQHEVEKWLADEGMESDALEGLRQLKPGEARSVVNRLDHHLRKAVARKRQPRRPLKTDQFTWIAIAIVLLLIVVAYLVVRTSM
jgi:ferric-dicitrate binding protein FerR (iron transport regulator)